VDVDVRYDGKLMPFSSSRPSEADLLGNESALATLSGFLIRQYADRLEAEEVQAGCRIRLHFDH
jgi:xanthine permease XanP